jgi:hypothetical protein
VGGEGHHHVSPLFDSPEERRQAEMVLTAVFCHALLSSNNHPDSVLAEAHLMADRLLEKFDPRVAPQ